MIQLQNRTIDDASIAHLSLKQGVVDGLAGFQDQVTTAASLWNNKTAANDGRVAFAHIKDALVNMGDGVEICHYCENFEATDIEHFYPKRLYPGDAFGWHNYLLACTPCNRNWKNEHFAIFMPAKSANEFRIPIKHSVFNKPANRSSVLLNPRNCNPLSYIILDLTGLTYLFQPRPGISARMKIRAKYTIELLGLNDRDALLAARKAAYNYYYDRLHKFVEVKRTNNLQELQNVTSDAHAIDITQQFQLQKDRILASIKENIEKYAHPTVWKEMIRQRKILPRTNQLFQLAPEALTW